MNYKELIEKFNDNDEEFLINAIDNAHAYEFLTKNAPRLHCPDTVIEDTFAFRTWVYRKHLRKVGDGFVVSEFLPEVPWADAENTISTAFGFHLDDGKWFHCSDKILFYIDFMLSNKGNSYHYFTPAITNIISFLKVTGNEWYIKENIDKFEAYFQGWEDRHLLPCGLYWSEDWFDAMEYSISGTAFDSDIIKGIKQSTSYSDGRVIKGIRPTLNSYMYGDAVVMAEVESSLNRLEKAKLYKAKAEKIKQLVEERLWDGSFYKAVHTKREYRKGFKYYVDESESLTVDELSTSKIYPEHNVRELIGFIPWIYKLAPEGREDVFNLLKDEEVFAGKTGFTTADISHERFLYDIPYHECLWNGYVWPYATSQTIKSVISLLNNYNQSVITNKDLYDFIKKYSEMHYLTENGETVNFIDEMMHPFKYDWATRTFMKNRGWKSDKGGYERGKDYNHSSYIDLVITGLCGVSVETESLTVNPKISGIWKWFKLENLPYKGAVYDIYYDEDGTKFNKGVGVVIEKVK